VAYREEGWWRVGRGDSAQTVRGGGWRRVGTGGVAGGGAPGDRGVLCGEGLGGVRTRDWRGGARTARDGGWWRVGIGGVVGGGARGSEGWRRALGWCGDWLVVAAHTLSAKSTHRD
jgi:hypothetical protein